MKAMKLAASALLLCCAAAPALADHVHLGIMVGGPFWGGYPGYYYGPPAYYYPPTVVTVPAPPTTYVEQPQSVPSDLQAPAPQVWYYCRNPKGYYPYIKTCPSGWREVAPTPADSGGAPNGAPN